MPDVDGFAPGTPSWVDLASPDPDASTAFYGALLGWSAREAGEGDEAGGYRMFTLRDRPVAGLGPLQEGGPPATWTTYIATADADATCEQVRAAGGVVFMEPMDVMEAGRMAVFADSGGAAFATWQPRGHSGAMIVGEPGALAWNELATGDFDGAKAFYGAVFGWEAQTASMGGIDYTIFNLPGSESPVAGMVSMGDVHPPQMPPHWMTHLQVADCAASTAKATELGADVVVDCEDVGMGVCSTIADPHGAVISLFQPSS